MIVKIKAEKRNLDSRHLEVLQSLEMDTQLEVEKTNGMLRLLAATRSFLPATTVCGAARHPDRIVANLAAT